MKVLLIALLFVSTSAFAKNEKTTTTSTTTTATASQHVVMDAKEVKWGPAPDGLPSTVKAAVLQGDPSKAAPFVIRLQFPGNTTVPLHTHPVDELVTVIDGNFYIGMGEKMDKKSARHLKPGAYFIMPAGMKHYGMSKGTTTIQINGTGPFGIEYANPADDPRKTQNPTTSTTTMESEEEEMDSSEQAAPPAPVSQ